MKTNSLRPVAWAVAMLALTAQAQEVATLPEVKITASKVKESSVAEISGNTLKTGAAKTSDVATLLSDLPGASTYSAGGVSSLPVINGLADDRLRIKVDGMDLIAACPNHMNSPLSYVDPNQLETLEVYTGVTPVSVGGDSIGAAVIAKSKSPEFAGPGEGLLKKGEMGGSYRSNGNGKAYNLGATVASETLSLSYRASSSEAGNYKAAEDFKNYLHGGVKVAGHDTAAEIGNSLAKDEVGSTAYKARNQLLTLAIKGDHDLLEGSVGYQDIPYELYPNQRMDMLGNTANRVNLRYEGKKDWGKLEVRAYHEAVDHHMDFGPDKAMYYGSITGSNSVVYPVMGMPMNTTGRTDGFSAKVDVTLAPAQLGRFGIDWQQYRLNDWWPPSPDCGVGICSGGMAPNTFWNIKDGQRDRRALFGELESRWSDQWFSQLGLRFEQVTMDAGDVQGYNTGMMYAGSAISATGGATVYNALNKQRTDNNIDWTALARYTPDENRTFEFGLAQKTRSPNLYERYAWSTNSMAMEMVNWVGDGNGYVGNPDLKPEVAYTLSVTGDWHSADKTTQLVVTPFYTHAQDYIDATRAYPGSTQTAATPNFVKLQFVNQQARLYGVNLAGRMPLGSNDWGMWTLKGLFNYTNGKNLETGDALYNIMPINLKTSLVQRKDKWENTLEWVAVAAKDDVSATRNEIKTPGFSLFNVRSTYTHKQLRVDFGIENLFNKMYYQPLGGAYVAQGYTMGMNRELNGNTTGMWGTNVPGMGRSLYVGVNYKF